MISIDINGNSPLTLLTSPYNMPAAFISVTFTICPFFNSICDF